jgi:phosphate transport system substrate-binding protein
VEPKAQKLLLLLVMHTCLGALLLTACTSTPAANTPALTLAATPQVRLNISGSEDVTAVLEACSDSFQKSVPDYRMRVLSGSGIDPSIKGVLKNVLDVAAMNRSATLDEQAQGLKFFEFGRASVAIFLHPGVGISNLTSDQVRAIFSGQITNWSQLGGPDLMVVPYIRPVDSPNTQVLRKTIFSDLVFSDTAEVIISGHAMRTAVAVTTGSIGYGAWPPVQATQINVQPVILDNIKPDDPAYPLTSVFGIGYLAEHEAKITPFIQWLQSEAGKTRLGSFDVIVSQEP